METIPDDQNKAKKEVIEIVETPEKVEKEESFKETANEEPPKIKEPSINSNKEEEKEIEEENDSEEMKENDDTSENQSDIICDKEEILKNECNSTITNTQIKEIYAFFKDILNNGN